MNSAATPQPETVDELQILDMQSQVKAASDMLKAISHEARLLILCILHDGEKSVSEIEIATNLPQATVSQHLARLRSDHLVAARRDGRQIFYRVEDNKASEIVSTLARLYCDGRHEESVLQSTDFADSSSETAPVIDSAT